MAARALQFGVDVVLDFGFWSRAERDEFRARAVALGARVELRYCAASRDGLLERLTARNENRPAGAFRVTEAQLDEFIRCFEPPRRRS